MQNGLYNAKKKEEYFPYQISKLHELKLEDYTPRYSYCNGFFKKFDRDVETMTAIFFFRRSVVSLVGIR